MNEYRDFSIPITENKLDVRQFFAHEKLFHLFVIGVFVCTPIDVEFKPVFLNLISTRHISSATNDKSEFRKCLILTTKFA